MRKYYNYQIKKSLSVTGLKTIENLVLKNGFIYPFESHEFYEFVYVISGDIICEYENKKTVLKCGDFKLITPKINHRYSAEKEANVFVVCFKCQYNVIDVLDEKINLGNQAKELLAKIINESKNAFEFPFVKKLKEKPNAPFGSQQLTENLIEELLILLMRDKIDMGYIKLVNTNAELQNHIVNDIVALLKQNVYGKISLNEICKKTYYSNTYLNKVFKSIKGTTIMQYYDRLKIEEAKKLVRQGYKNTSISEKLCYDNPNYFAKTFKKHTGKSPSFFKHPYHK